MHILMSSLYLSTFTFGFTSDHFRLTVYTFVQSEYLFYATTTATSLNLTDLGKDFNPKSYLQEVSQ